MSAAVTRTKGVEHDTSEFTQAETGIPVKLEARPVIEDHGMTPLMRAACDGSAGTVQALLDRGAEVNAKRTDGFNALALAAFFGHSQVVWLLLENGADLAATGRSETLPEMWADIRGFVDIGDTLREARAAKQVVEAPNSRTTVIAEPARFARPGDKENFQPAGIPGSDFDVSVIAETLARETPLVMTPTTVMQESESSVIQSASETTLVIMPEPVDEESQPPVIDAGPETSLAIITEPMDEESQPSVIDEITASRVEPLADIFPPDKPEHAYEQPVIKPPVRVLKTLPEIEDPPPLVVPEFHPGSAFVSRITSSRKNLVALILAVWLLGIGIAAFLFPQIRKSLADLRKAPVTNSTNSTTPPSNPVAGSGTSVSGTVETSSAATTESTTAPASKDIEETTADNTIDSPADTEGVESTSRVESAEVPEKGSAGDAAAKGSENRAHSRSSTSAGNSGPEPSQNGREFSVPISMSRSAAPARKQRAVSRAVKFKQQPVAEEPPKPAPLSVEMSRSRSVLSTPARSANEVPSSQPPPLSIISGKPKSKVIQWP